MVDAIAQMGLDGLVARLELNKNGPERARTQTQE